MEVSLGKRKLSSWDEVKEEVLSAHHIKAMRELTNIEQRMLKEIRRAIKEILTYGDVRAHAEILRDIIDKYMAINETMLIMFREFPCSQAALKLSYMRESLIQNENNENDELNDKDNGNTNICENLDGSKGPSDDKVDPVQNRPKSGAALTTWIMSRVIDVLPDIEQKMKTAASILKDSKRIDGDLIQIRDEISNSISSPEAFLSVMDEYRELNLVEPQYEMWQALKSRVNGLDKYYQNNKVFLTPIRSLHTLNTEEALMVQKRIKQDLALLNCDNMEHYFNKSIDQLASDGVFEEISCLRASKTVRQVG